MSAFERTLKQHLVSCVSYVPQSTHEQCQRASARHDRQQSRQKLHSRLTCKSQIRRTHAHPDVQPETAMLPPVPSINWASRGSGNVPKIILNDTVNLFFEAAISILEISNHNSFRVLFDKIASVYFI